jgi:hypothetical protein
MSNQRWTIDRFLPAYLEAAEMGVTKEDFAAQLGIKPETVYQRAYALRRNGMDIPLLKSAGKVPMLEQADRILAEYRAKKGAVPNEAAAQKGPAKKKEVEQTAAADAVLDEAADDSIESILGIR